MMFSGAVQTALGEFTSYVTYDMGVVYTIHWGTLQSVTEIAETPVFLRKQAV